MKLLGLLLSFLSAPIRQRNARLLAVLLAILVGLVVLFSFLFHLLMEAEGQRHSWPTAVYWTLVTMTTLGFGDITFQSDAGRIFSVVVLLTGTLFLLILLPFTFIQFVWVPWMTRREAERAPRSLPAGTAGHLVLTAAGAIEDALIERASRIGLPYVLLVAELEEALRLHDRGYQVMVGSLDDPATYRAARVEAAALVVATRSDTTNTNIVFTVQELSSRVPILAGTAPQLAAYDEAYAAPLETLGPVVVIGGGRVGRRVGVSLAKAGVDFKIVEKLAERVRDPAHYVVGDAARLEVLAEAGLPRATAVVITTHDDDINVYLSIYCRCLRPEMQIIARANLDRNVSTLYRAGADAVLSYASTGAAAVWNRLRPEGSLLLSEGLEVFRFPAPASLVGRTLGDAEIPSQTGCGVLAVTAPRRGEGCRRDRLAPIPAGAELLLVGDAADQARLRATYPPARRNRRWIDVLAPFSKGGPNRTTRT